MARATRVEKARRALPEHGIKVGDTYYWWSFKRGGKRYSKTPPRRSQLTQSSFFGAVYDVEDDIAALEASASLSDDRDSIVERLREIGEECQSSLDNMPEGLQQGSTGELLQSRVEAMEQAAQEFDDIDMDSAPDDTDTFVNPDREEDETDEDYAERCATEKAEWEEEHDAEAYWQEKLDEMNAISIEAP